MQLNKEPTLLSKISEVETTIINVNIKNNKSKIFILITLGKFLSSNNGVKMEERKIYYKVLI